MDEVRLIEVTTREGHACPVDLRFGVNTPHHLLETTDAAEKLRREPHLSLEELDESALAEADIRAHLRDTASSRPVELTQRAGDGAMPVQRLDGAFQEMIRQESEPEIR